MKERKFKMGDIVVPTCKTGNSYNLENLIKAKVVDVPQVSQQVGNFYISLEVVEGYFSYRGTKYPAPQSFGMDANCVKLEYEGDEDYEFF